MMACAPDMACWFQGGHKGARLSKITVVAFLIAAHWSSSLRERHRGQPFF